MGVNEQKKSTGTVTVTGPDGDGCAGVLWVCFLALVIYGIAFALALAFVALLPS